MIFWKKKSSVFTGFDVGSSTIKVVSIDISGKNPVLLDVFCTKLDNNHPFELLANQFPNQKVSISIPCSKLDTRFLSLPNIPEQDLRNMVGFEIESKLDYKLEEACFDYTLSNTRPISDNQKTQIIAFACRRSAVQSLIERFLPFQFDIKVMDTLTMGLMNAYRALLPEFASHTYLGINVEEKGAAILISQSGNLLFTRNFPIHLHLVSGNGSEDHLWIDEIATEIRRTIQYCKIHFHVDMEKLHQILISGAGLQLNRICDSLAQETPVPCRILDPFDSPLWGNGTTVHTVDCAPQYVAALGLALRLSGESI